MPKVPIRKLSLGEKLNLKRKEKIPNPYAIDKKHFEKKKHKSMLGKKRPKKLTKDQKAYILEQNQIKEARRLRKMFTE